MRRDPIVSIATILFLLAAWPAQAS